jgi:hypothetical protein
MAEKTRLVAIHQPNYLPWLGYWFKIYVSDVFVFLDSVQFSKHSFTKRTKIILPGESDKSTYLSLPIKKSNLATNINEIEIKKEQWVNQHLNKIKNNYQKSPFFDHNYQILEHILNQVKFDNNLSTLNESIIKLFLESFSFPKTTIVNSSKMKANGKQEALLCEIILELNGNTYLSGVGAKKYQEATYFKEKNIKLIYSDFYQFMNENPYQQGNNSFVNGLSIIDALFYLGIDGIFDIFESFKTKLSSEYDF